MKIEYMYSTSAGRQPQAEEALQLAIEATGVEADVVYIEVLNSEDARDQRFLGSPTIRVDGIDVEYGDRAPEEYQSGARYYNTPEGWKPFPHARLIANTILEVMESQKAN